MLKVRRIPPAVLVAFGLTCVANPLRAQKPSEAEQLAAEASRLFETLELTPGEIVADIGAGKGEMSVEMARRLGPDGRVYATDINKERLADIRAAASNDHLGNVIVLEGAERVSNLPEGCCDAIFIRFVYHHFTDPTAMNRSLSAALKPGGRLAIIDFEPGGDSKLPKGVPANRGGHGITPAVLRPEVATAGLSWATTIMDWPDGKPPVDQRGFLVLFRRKQ